MIPSWEDSECWALVPSGAGLSLRQNIRLSGERQGHGSYSILYLSNQQLLSLCYVPVTGPGILGGTRASRATGHHTADSSSNTGHSSNGQVLRTRTIVYCKCIFTYLIDVPVSSYLTSGNNYWLNKRINSLNSHDVSCMESK